MYIAQSTPPPPHTHTQTHTAHAHAHTQESPGGDCFEEVITVDGISKVMQLLI